MTFADFGLTKPLLDAVLAEGYTEPTPIQTQAIPHLMAGRDLLGCAQTGTGKTAAFALPLLHRLTHTGNPPRGSGRRIRGLVLSPTRELAAQIAGSFQAYGRLTALRHTVVYGGVNQNPQTRALQHGVDILVATPGRLWDLMNQGFIDLSGVASFVLDEADRMLDMGFLPDLRRIIGKLPVKRQTALFSATMPAPIETLARDILVNPVSVRIAPVRATTDLIEQVVCFVPQEQKIHLLSAMLMSQPVERAIVFSRTKHGADRIAKQLNRQGLAAEALHGNKSQSARGRILAAFKGRAVQVLVATDLAARGLDIDGVSHVFNFDVPEEPETYSHRIGRTGRAGATGVAYTFCSAAERRWVQAIERMQRRTIPVLAKLPIDLSEVAEPASFEERARPARRGGARPQSTYSQSTHGQSAPTPAPANRHGSAKKSTQGKNRAPANGSPRKKRRPMASSEY